MTDFNQMRDVIDRGKVLKGWQKNLKASWYFDHWYEKLIIVLGEFALIYSFIRIVAQGLW